MTRTPRRNMVRDTVFSDEQAAKIEHLAGRANRPMAEIIRCLVDIGLWILLGDTDLLEPAHVISLPDERARRERAQRGCGHSTLHRTPKGVLKCSWCGKHIADVAGDELGEPA